ncbi:MAG: hypothetical protein ABFC24_08465 [Methanoregulaceae archaeon]
MPTVMIRIEPAVKNRLDALRVHPRETYGDIILRLVDAYAGSGAGNSSTAYQGSSKYSTVYKTGGSDDRREIDID